MATISREMREMPLKHIRFTPDFVFNLCFLSDVLPIHR